jgi:hypothetical protein
MRGHGHGLQPYIARAVIKCRRIHKGGDDTLRGYGRRGVLRAPIYCGNIPLPLPPNLGVSLI